MESLLLQLPILLAQAEPAAPAPNPIASFLPIILIGVIFYFLLIRPQQKRQKEHRQMIEALKTGDQVVTSGGIHGRITNVKDSTVLVKIAENTKVEMDKASVASVIKSAG